MSDRTKIFMDLEFTGLHQGTTIVSLGMVSEFGSEFYAEFIDYDPTQVSEWVQENVIDKLRLNVSCPEKDLYKGRSDFVRDRVDEWLGRYGEVEIWGDCMAYDWILFCQMWGMATNIPSNIYYIPFDISTMFRMHGIDPDVDREAYSGIPAGSDKHSSIHDARVTKACYNRLEYDISNVPPVSKLIDMQKQRNRK